jgi:SAM-dependent methyltransferase
MWKATALKAALELDVFTVIANGHHTLKDIAAATQSSTRGMHLLLDALCPLGFLSKSDNEYALTPTSEVYFVPGKPTYYGDFFQQVGLAWEARGRIAEGIRTGEALGVDATNPDSDDLWASDYSTALLDWPQRADQYREIWETLNVNRETKPGLHILDVACGPGVKSFVLAQEDTGARVTALDLPKMLDRVTTKVAEAMGVKEQVTFRADDILTADLGAESFDIVLFGLILYFFNPDQVRDILHRAYQALKPGGLLVIHSGMADEKRCENEHALLVAFQLFIFCPESEVYTFSEYEELLEQVGFTHVTHNSDTLVSAIK